MSPLAGVPILFLSFPGVLPLRGATAGLLYAAPRRGSKIPLANASHLLDKLRFIDLIYVLCINTNDAFSPQLSEIQNDVDVFFVYIR